MKTFSKIWEFISMLLMMFGFYGVFFALTNKLMEYSNVEEKWLLVVMHVGILLIGIRLNEKLYDYLKKE